jgi:hypothetical protein
MALLLWNFVQLAGTHQVSPGSADINWRRMRRGVDADVFGTTTI